MMVKNLEQLVDWKRYKIIDRGIHQTNGVEGDFIPRHILVVSPWICQAATKAHYPHLSPFSPPPFSAHCPLFTRESKVIKTDLSMTMCLV